MEQRIDEPHVKASGCGGKLALRPGFHSTEVPYTDWIGKRTENGTLIWFYLSGKGSERLSHQGITTE